MRSCERGGSLLQRWPEPGLALVLVEDVLDLLRGEVERLAGGHLPDERLVQAQADNLLDLRAFRVPELLARRLERRTIGTKINRAISTVNATTVR